MSKRDDLFQKFGPLLTESIVLVLLQYINTLRLEQGMKLITYDSILDHIDNHHSHLDEYPWMKQPGLIDQQPLLDKTLQTPPLPKPKSFFKALYSTLQSVNPFSRS